MIVNRERRCTANSVNISAVLNGVVDVALVPDSISTLEYDREKFIMFKVIQLSLIGMKYHMN